MLLTPRFCGLAKSMRIRNFRPGDEPILRSVFHSSVHTLANKHYSPAQLNAWAPQEYDVVQWAERMRRNQPFVAELDGTVAGYADLQESGYIDQFFVAGAYAGLGVARALMAHIHAAARRRGIAELWADVSLTAESFFAASGFVVEARNVVAVRGVELMNARMRKPMEVSANK